MRSLETHCAFREWRWLETAWHAGEAWVRDRSSLWVNCFCRLVECVLGVHKARSEWFICNSVPWCRVPSLPVARPRSKMEASWGVGVSLAGWLCCPSPSTLWWEIRRIRGWRHVFAPPPDPGRPPWPPAQPSASQGWPRQTLPQARPWQWPRHGPEYPLSPPH